MFNQIIRLFRTISYLKASQIYMRIFFKLISIRPELSPAPELSRQVSVLVALGKKPASMTESGEFRFLNCTAALADVGWNSPEVSDLWRYNLHYFDDLNSVSGSERSLLHHDLIARWIEDNPASTRVGWHPYPISIRMTNWIKWDLTTGNMESVAIHSLAIQARYLMKRVEWHLLGNHILTNAKALTVAGLYFDGPEADSWLEKGLGILDLQIDEQILKDGGHFELSPMYHALVLEDILDIINISRVFSSRTTKCLNAILKKLDKLIPLMFSWLNTMTHPDGDTSFFNDSVSGIALINSELVSYAERLGYKISKNVSNFHHLAESGFFRASVGDFTLIADIGQIGPNYIPGHAHADSLSFELSILKQRVIVNSGIFEYALGPERLRQRSTKSHSTVEIENQSSSEIWGSFRVGRRAQTTHQQSKINADGVLVAAEHNGYYHLKNRVIHRREWQLNMMSLEVEDTVIGIGRLEHIVVRYFLSPKLTPRWVTNGNLNLIDEQQNVILEISTEGGVLGFENTEWYPEFGLSVPNYCLTIKTNGKLPIITSTKFKYVNP